MSVLPSLLDAVSARRWLSSLVLATALVGCSSAPPAGLGGLPQRVELSGVPFFRGNANASAPMALAAAMNQEGIRITPGLLESPLGLPEGVERLEAQVPEVAQSYGLLVYPLAKGLDALLVQVAAGNPVLLRYQQGSAFWAEPRYALLIGYDRLKRHVLLRSGMTRRLTMDFDDFMTAWQAQGGWAVLIQPPTRLPAQVDAQRWRQAAAALAQDGQEGAAQRALQTLGQ